MRPDSFALVLFSALFLSSCAAKYTWEHPTLPASTKAADTLECKASARRKADKEYAQGQFAKGRIFETAPSTLDRQMDRYDAKKDQTRLFERCMTKRGYTKVKKVKKAPEN
jgi:hypothetical protein